MSRLAAFGAFPPRVDPATDALFVGRETECRLLDTLVASASAGGAAGVVVGPAGIGKTALLRRVASRSPSRVQWVRGLESEAVLPFAGAADVLTPLRQHFGAVPGAQRRALEVALALAEGEHPSSLAVCTGALGVLAAAGAEEPLVILVDDAQWVDAESRQLLLFVARRLVTERIAIVFAVREEPGAQPLVHDLPSLQLTGLSPQECQELTRRRQLAASEHVMREVTRETGGNPLALLETLAHGHAGSSAAGAGNRVTVGASIQGAWRPVLEQLSERTRRALFVVAAARSPGPPMLPEVLRALDLTLDDLAPAERRGLVRVDQDGVELRHPLMRQVLTDLTPLAVRLPTYRALADVAPPDQRAWYLSLAAAGPDDDLATVLATAAADARGLGAHHSAAACLRRAAELTADPDVRADRLLAAASQALLAGDAAHAAQWCADSVIPCPDPVFEAAVTTVRGRALTWMGHPAQAQQELIRVVDLVRSEAPQLAAELMCEAVMPMAMAGDLGRCREAVAEAEALETQEVRLSCHAQTMLASAHLLSGDVAAGRARLDLAELMLPALDLLEEQHALAVLAQGRSHAEQLGSADRLINTLVDLLRRNGAPALLGYALAVRSDVGFRLGRWPGAYADAAESLQWAEELQQRGVIGSSLVTMARLDAARGERALCEDRIERSRREIGPYGIDCLLVYEPAVLGLAALTAGEPDVAAEHLEHAWEQLVRQGIGNPAVVPFAGDLIEAHVRSNRPERARELLTWLDERAGETGLVYPAAAGHRCRGLLAEDVDAAAAEFEAARRLHHRCRMPFELARTLLCEGEVLRRGRRRAGARAALREARRLFQGLGARPWADRAGRELAASGDPGVAPPCRSGDLDRLTPQELQVARMVAAGKNNTETAAALFVSRKTVEAHLTHVYRKLAIRSRTELTGLVLARGVSGTGA